MILRRRRKSNYQLDPDEIFLDSSNLPSFDTQQCEGRIEKPISRTSLVIIGLCFLVIGLLFFGRVFLLQVVDGQKYADRSRNNSLRQTVVFAERGNIYDRNNVELAWNNPGRTYIADPGFAHILGYLGYPSDKETTDNDYLDKELIGKDGVEETFNEQLSGQKGLKIEEVSAAGKVETDHLLSRPEAGKPLTLSIDARVQKKFYEIVKTLAVERGFSGGAGMVMDVRTGEMLSLVSYPEYDPNVLTSRSDNKLISSYLTNKNQPFLDRAISGLYTPGSVFKPFLAVGALNEKIISPDKKILSTGQISIPNPYDPTKKTVFGDWKAHGWTNMKEAIAVSSDVYFYAVGGGYADQKGLGINNIGKYAKLFGLSQKTGIELGGESEGTIPDPEWKAANFGGEPWRIGDTYHTAIGQYGVHVTPIQVLRGTSAIANGGKLLTPTILKNTGKSINYKQLSIPDGYLQVARDGMRLGAVAGTGRGANVDFVHMATKTGTAELGVSKANINSWAEGFWPYEDPHYAFVVVLEKGHRENEIGGIHAVRQLVDWMHVNTPEYLK